MRILTIDLGGSALKAVLFEADGIEVARARVPCGFVEDANGRSEQDADRWEEALDGALAIIGGSAPSGLEGVAALAITAFTRTQVFVDATARPVRPALGFRDTRAGEIVAAAQGDSRLARHRELAQLNAHHPLARALWLAHEEPEAWARTRMVLEPKDYLALRLTGVAATDPISVARWTAATGGGRASLASLLGLVAPLSPPQQAPGSRVGRVRSGLPGPRAALAGAVVALTSHDSWTSVLGLGGLRPGGAYCIAGTTEVTGLLAAAQATAPGLMGLPWGDRLWHVGGPTLNGGDAIAWILRLIGEERPATAATLDDRLAGPTGPPLLFHPYLHGERVPHWDERLRGAFLGLDARHGPADLVRAVVTGLAFSCRDILERAEAAAGEAAAVVRVGGGGARSAAWRRIRAEVLGRPLLTFADDEAGSRGALAVARVALGLDRDLREAADRVLPPAVQTRPGAAAATRLEPLFAAWRASFPALQATSHALAAAPR